MEDGIRMSLAEAYGLAERILIYHGVSPDQANALAETLVAGERDECASHGLYRLLGCVHSIRVGKALPDAVPEIADLGPAIVRVDGGHGFSPLAFRLGLPVLVAKARQTGIAALAITNCFHYSALWAEVEPLAEHGLVSFAYTSNHAWVAPAGGTKPIFGTNPIAFGWPRPGENPFVFDFATSATARGEIELRHRAGKPIPGDWALDQLGQPTTDPAAALLGSLLTFGHHKGSALAAMVELIAGPLIGDRTSAESLAYDAGSGAAPLGGELIIAIDPARFLGETTLANMARGETLFEGMLEQGARLPSQRRYEARVRSEREGVIVPKALYGDLRKLLPLAQAGSSF